MTLEEKRRELFEVWWRDHKGHGELPARYAGGQYIRDSALWAWIGFNAALDAVVIHLPAEVAPTSYNSPANSWNDALRKSLAAIESTGLGLKVLP